MTHFLRLFPLQSVVLFPGEELPLMVFEERYRRLTKECVENDEPFGVVLLRSGFEAGDRSAVPHDVGTTARIAEASPMGDGRLRVEAVGELRFRIASLNRDLPYLAAEVEFLDEGDSDLSEDTLANARGLARNLVQAMAARRGGWVQDIPLPEGAAELSYALAQLFQGNQSVQQALLELNTVAERLLEEQRFMRMVIDRLVHSPRRASEGPYFSQN